MEKEKNIIIIIDLTIGDQIFLESKNKNHDNNVGKKIISNIFLQ